MNYHNEIMNLPTSTQSLLYKEGHRDARHAAAEIALKADAKIEQLTMERDAQYDLNVSMVAKHAAQEAKIERLEDTLADIEIYATDTLSGPLIGTDDLEWYRDGVVEIVKRVQAALAAGGGDHELEGLGITEDRGREIRNILKKARGE